MIIRALDLIKKAVYENLHIQVQVYMRMGVFESWMHRGVFEQRKGLRYRVAKTRRIPYLYRSFSAKVTYI